MKILDCTLRDGGYYNNWDFPEEIVNAYLKSVKEANIDYVELGLRNFPKNEFLGAFAYTTEKFLNSLELPEGPTYGVMVDAKTILTSGKDIISAVNDLFIPASQSKIKLVRIAAHFDEVESSSQIAFQLKELGYIVGLNLMQAGGKSSDIISQKASLAKSWDALEVLYFADSLGNMDSVEVERIVEALQKEWKGPLGIHTHNNMGKGLDNTITASKAGVAWLDATITGMGRGAGNTQTESLLALLDKKGSVYNPKPIYKLVIRYFEPMQKRYGWGSSLLYFLGAQNDVHPTYIQNLLSNTHYGTEEIVGAIDYLSNLDGTTSYNGTVLSSALSFNKNDKATSGTTALSNIFDNKEVLIVSNSPNVKKYKSAIDLYISNNKPIVISINISDYIAPELINYYVISHNSKFLSDANKYRNLNKPLILPVHRFTNSELELISECEIIDYGVEVKEGKLLSNKTYASIPFDITIAYALSALQESKPKLINAVGFDGYDKSDPRQLEMISLIEMYNKIDTSCEIVSLTPTTYPIKNGSIYAPII